MRMGFVLLALIALAACGGKAPVPSEDPIDPACIVLGTPSPTALTATDDLLIEIEVRFVRASDTFFAEVGVDFDIVLPPESADPPGFGGKFVTRPTYAVPAGVVAHVEGADILVPNGHRPGSYLPAGYVSAAPGLNAGASFVQAPGADDECVDVYELLRFPLSGSDNVPATTAIVPNGDLGAGNGLAIERLDPPALQMFLDAVAQSMDADLLSAPTVRLYDGQRAISVIQTGQVPASDLLPIVTSDVYGGVAIEFVRTGITLDVRPVVTATRDAIVLEMRPLSHAVVATIAGTHQVGSTPILVQSPIMVPTTVQTMVTVPDGGTIVLGGLKDVTDDGMPGVPLLSRLPYVNRLFQNTSSAATQESLMIMITPRIIINQDGKR